MFLVIFLFAFYFFDSARYEYVGHEPQHYVEHGQQRDVDIRRQRYVESRICQRENQYGYECGPLWQAQIEQFVMYVRFVGQEGVAMLPQTHEKHAHHIQTGDNHRREGQRHYSAGFAGTGAVLQQFDAQYADDKTYGEAARIAHEYLAVTLRIAEDVVVEERDEYAQRRKGYHRIDTVALHHEECAVNHKSDAAQTRCQAVDAVDKVYGVDEEDYHQHRQRIAHHGRQNMYAEHAVEVVNPHSRDNHQHRTQYLHDELFTVAHTHQIVGDAYQIEHYERAESEQQRHHVPSRLFEQVVMLRKVVYTEQQHNREAYDRHKGEAAKTRHHYSVYFAFVRHVEQVATERYAQYLRDKYSRKEHAHDEHDNDI